MQGERVDFDLLKREINIIDVAKFLNLDLTEEGDYLKGTCPTCSESGDRDLSIRPDWGTYKCFRAEANERENFQGSLVYLTAHIKRLSPPQAGRLLKKHFLDGEAPTKEEPKKSQPSASEGFPSAVCKSAGIGYAKAADLVDRVPTVWKKPARIPIRSDTGHILGYILVEEALLPKEWSLP